MNITKEDVGKLVLLRNNTHEVLTGFDDKTASRFVVESNRHSWDKNGHWHCDEPEHRLDIVMVYHTMKPKANKANAITLDKPLQVLHRNQPEDAVTGTRISWVEGEAVFELYAPETESYFYMSTEEMPQFIAGLEAIYDKIKGGVK